jgi:hypothetical protein
MTTDAKRKYHREYYLKNKTKILKQAKDSYDRNRKTIQRRSKEWLAEHPEYRLWKQAKDSSKQRGLEFSITVEDIVIPKYCTYLGIELTKHFDSGRYDSNISLDRIDNSKGYIKDNIQVISSKANFMKRNATIEELIQFARGILNTHS